MIFLRVIDWEPELEIVMELEPSDEPPEEGEFRFITDNGNIYWKHTVDRVGSVTTLYGALGSMVMPLEPDPPYPLLHALLQKLIVKYKLSKREAIRSGRTAPGVAAVQLPFEN